MKNKLLQIFIFTLMSFTIYAQDIIYKNDKTQIKSKIIEVEENVVKYKKFEFLDGPTYTIKKSDIFMIAYKNGEKELFDDEKPVAKNTSKPETNANTNSKTNIKIKPKQSLKKPVQENTSSESEFTIQKKSFTTYGLLVGLNNFGNFTIPFTVFTFETPSFQNIAVVSQTGMSYTSTVLPSFESLGMKEETIDAFSVSTELGLKYYFNEVLKVDPNKIHLYGGALASYNSVFVITEDADTTSSTSNFGFTGLVGGRYYFKYNWAIQGDVQFAQGGANLLLGVSYRLMR